MGADLSEQPYAAPPIVDAVIGITFATALSEQQRLDASKKFTSDYPLVEEVVQTMVEVRLDGATSTSEVSTGVREKMARRSVPLSPDILMIGTKLFTVATVAPYPGW